MKNWNSLILGTTLMVGAATFGCERNEIAQPKAETAKTVTPKSAEGAIIPGQFIVLFNEAVIPPAISYLDMDQIQSREEKVVLMTEYNAKVETKINQWLAQNGIKEEQVLYRYTSVAAGVAIRIDEATQKRIGLDPSVASIEHDREEHLPPFVVENIDRGNNRAQTTPCGITNAGGFATATTDRWIWIVDTGIDLDHPDLNVVTTSPYPATFVGGTADDCNGHGTHCAGIAGARNNTIGVVGVAAGAPVVPVRVFGCSGGSSSSTIISGINHVGTYDYAGDVVNLSLGGYYGTSGCSTGSPYRTPILNLTAGGTRVAIASGNNNSLSSYYQPGCISGTNIFTVTNMTCAKTYYNDPTYGGNRGMPPVDVIATGTSVYSTYAGGTYATLTGTSMATPHVAGIMQVRNAGPLTSGTVSYLGVNYPIAVR
jgi:hypothetical protein